MAMLKSSLSKWLTKSLSGGAELPAKIYLKDLSTTTRQLVYSGPFNPFIQRLKLTMVGSTAATIVGSPLLLHYLASSSTSWTMSLFYFVSMSGASLAQTALAHGLLKRYVMHAYRLVPEVPRRLTDSKEADQVSPEDHLELVTLDFFGRPKRQIYSASQLESSVDGVGTISPIASRTNQKSFFILLEKEDYFSRLVARLRASSSK